MESNTKRRKLIKEDGAEKIYEDDRWFVVRPFTQEAAILYGKDTKWCSTITTSYNPFYDYLNAGTLYYIIDKKKLSGIHDKLFFFMRWTGGYELCDKNDYRMLIGKRTPDIGTKEGKKFLNEVVPLHVKDSIHANYDRLKPIKPPYVFKPNAMDMYKAFTNGKKASYISLFNIHNQGGKFVPYYFLTALLMIFFPVYNLFRVRN